MTFMDRFLSTCHITKNHLQLLGTTCLLLASKLREPSSRGLPADILVFYTDNSITVPDLCVSILTNIITSIWNSTSPSLSVLWFASTYLLCSSHRYPKWCGFGIQKIPYQDKCSVSLSPVHINLIILALMIAMFSYIRGKRWTLIFLCSPQLVRNTWYWI